MSFIRNTQKQTATETYERSESEANTHITIRTASFAAYASEKNALLRKVRNAAQKLVATETVLGIRFAVPKSLSTK